MENGGRIMKKFIIICFAAVLFGSGISFPSNSQAASVNVVNESKEIYRQYFQSGKHIDATKLGDAHNGVGSKGSEGPGFFRAAQDAIFLVSLHGRLAQLGDPLAPTVNNDAIAALDHIKARLELSKTRDSKGWYLGATESPDTGMLLMAFSKAYDFLNLSSTKESEYKSIMNDLLKALENARNTHKIGNSDFFSNPDMTSCGPVLKSNSSNNIFAVAAAGLGSYALHVGGSGNPYRGVMTDFAMYVRDSQLSNGLWLIGGKTRDDGCDMHVGYDTWSVMGSAIAGMGSTGIPQYPQSSFFNSAVNGLDGLSAYYDATDSAMNLSSNGLIGSSMRIIKTESVPSYALGVSYLGTPEARNFFDKLYPAAKADIESSTLNNPSEGAPHFHRLIQGLSGALETDIWKNR
jgi:hypothetical protein